MALLEYSSKTFWRDIEAISTDWNASADVAPVVTEILDAVRRDGDSAVLHYTEKFDGAVLEPAGLRLRNELMKAACAGLDADDRERMREAIHCVRDFHRKTRPSNWQQKNPQGARVGEQFTAFNRVGIYVPGGSAPLVSTVIMTGVLARVAGCSEVAVFTPPDRDGAINPSILAALDLIGINEVYRIGGVQAVAAMAYGTATVKPVDKIFGPGNAYVIEAKRQLFGQVGIDLLPGPSELMVLADDSANVEWVAADLVAQGEHGSGKEKIYLVTTSRRVADGVAAEVERIAKTLGSNPNTCKVLSKRFLVVVTPTLEAAVEVANFMAPEHLELVVESRALSLARSVKTAGAILIGAYTPTALGDFTAGPSHTLPTGRTGRFFSGLQVTDFMHRSSIVEYDVSSVRRALPVVEMFSRLEGLEWHGKSVALRYVEDGRQARRRRK